MTLALAALLTGSAMPTRVSSEAPSAALQSDVIPAWAEVELSNAPVQEGDIYYVDREASGDDTGLSWEHAFTELEDALEIAVYSDEVWVAEGVYKPTAGVTRTASFTLVEGVGIYGGFTGTESEREERDPEVHITVLSGDLDDNDTTDANGVITSTDNITGDNAYHVITGSGVTGTAVLDGFTITGGKADGSLEDRRGGGMDNAGGSPTLGNLIFSGNRAGDGGGIYNEAGSDPTLTDVTFSNNRASAQGGGMDNFSSSPMLTDVTFNNNYAGLGGGGMYNENHSNPVLIDADFSDNQANGFGGGIYNYNSSLTLTNAVLSGNGAGFIGTGGGMCNRSSVLTLTNVIFRSNRATSGTPGGSSFGGGMYSEGTDLTLTNITFNDNQADIGAGTYNDTANVTLTNCILWDNDGVEETAQISATQDSTVTVSYSLIQNASIYTGTGVIADDPLFVDAPDDLHLRGDSPAIDAGDDSAVSVAFDLDGGPRRVDMPTVENTGNGCVDMGAYELSPPPPTISIDGPTLGALDTPYTFTAIVEPLTTTTPITYVWRANAQAPLTHTGGLSDTVAFTWTVAGKQTITATAINSYASVSDTHEVFIGRMVFLPLVVRNR